MTGTGGNGSGSSNYGVFVNESSQIASGSGMVEVIGTGGGGTGSESDNIGVYVNGTNSRIDSNGGLVTVTGMGGGGSGDGNFGVRVTGTNARIGGVASVSGIGTNNSEAIRLENSGSIVSYGNAPLLIIADSLNLTGTPSGMINSGFGATVIYLRTAGTLINLGGPDVLTGNPRTLGLSASELDQVTGGFLVIGRNDTEASGGINVSSDIIRSAATDVRLLTGGSINFSGGRINTGGVLRLDSANSPAAIKPLVAGADVIANALSLAGNLEININGPTVDVDYTQLSVNGQIFLSEVQLVISGDYQPQEDDSFVLIDNDGDDAIVGEFAGLPEGALVAINGGMFQKRITYVGGDGNDVVLTVNYDPSVPVDSDSAPKGVPEDSPLGTPVGLTASSFGYAGATITYSLLNDAVGRFAIDSATGIVTVANGGLLNYESATSHSITVTASDGDLSTNAVFVIEVTNVAPFTPFDFEPADNEVMEGAPNGTQVGVTALAFDPAGGTVTYSLSDDAGGRFAIDSSTGIVTVLDGTLLDYESATSHTITVVASDGLLTSSQTYLIEVENANEALTLDVQQGQTQRSYVRTVDLVFESDDGLDDVVNLALNRIQLERFVLSGAGPATLVNLTGAVSRTGSQVELDFGIHGIGGNRNTTVGDGHYRLSVDVDGDGIFETVQHFYRLLGDVDGDRQVNAVDASLILAAYGTSDPERDVNGDGLVNSIDRTLAIRSLGLALDADLLLDD